MSRVAIGLESHTHIDAFSSNHGRHGVEEGEMLLSSQPADLLDHRSRCQWAGRNHQHTRLRNASHLLPDDLDARVLFDCRSHRLAEFVPSDGERIAGWHRRQICTSDQREIQAV